MYQRKCSECGCELNDTAAACPSCGAPAGTFCAECGGLVPSGAAACPGCGAPVQVNAEPPAQQPGQDPAGSLTATLAFIFAFFFPPVGLILSIVGLKSKQVQDKKKLKISLVISIILTAALTVFLIIFLPRAIRAYSTGKKISDFFKGLVGAIK